MGQSGVSNHKHASSTPAQERHPERVRDQHNTSVVELEAHR